MGKHEVTLRDIAKAAGGISYTTVSRALRDSPLISQEKRQAIQKLAAELGYAPNALAQGLRGVRSNTIGLVTPALGDPFFAELTVGIQEVAQPQGISILLAVSTNTAEGELEIIERLRRHRVAGILTGASRITEQYKDRLLQINIPTVLINAQLKPHDRSLCWIANNDPNGAEQAVNHLLELGHTAIGYLGVKSRPKSSGQRLEGYQAAMIAAGVYRENLVKIAEKTSEASSKEDLGVGEAYLDYFLDRKVGATAIVAYNDSVALGLLHACRNRKKKIQVPEELSIVGYDDIVLAAYAAPPLTTISQRKKLIGTLAMQMLLKLLNDEPVEDRLELPDLVVRESTAPPR
ncbi:MAG TPA: LacI family DNA-binding transcriptional regulator [Ktedonobacterales bacterium]